MCKKISLDKALEQTGYKKKYIAEKLGITPEYLPKFIDNCEKISIEKAAIICELTGLKISDLDFGIKKDFF